MFDFDLDPIGNNDDDIVTSRQLDHAIKLERRAVRREFIAGLRHEALIELVPTLPPPDVDMWIISTGDGAQGRHGKHQKAFDFGDFIPHIIAMFGAGCSVYVSTWCANFEHTQMLIHLMQTGDIERLTFLSDGYFQQRTPAIAAALVLGLEPFGTRARYKLAKNHCKLICIRDASHTRYCCVQGSANLNMQPRAENYTLSTAPEVYHFLTEQFFEAMLQQTQRTHVKTRQRTPKPLRGNMPDESDF